MSLTRKEIEEIEQKPFKEPPLTNFFVGTIRLLSKIPPIKKYLNESIGGLSGRIFQYWENKKYEKATKVALFALENDRYIVNHKYAIGFTWYIIFFYSIM